MPPIASLTSSPLSILQSTVFFGALTVLSLLYGLRHHFPALLLYSEKRSPAREC
jgi:hypothetical protein